jgi:hypothetical protein
MAAEGSFLKSMLRRGLRGVKLIISGMSRFFISTRSAPRSLASGAGPMWQKLHRGALAG